MLKTDEHLILLHWWSLKHSTKDQRNCSWKYGFGKFTLDDEAVFKGDRREKQQIIQIHVAGLQMLERADVGMSRQWHRHPIRERPRRRWLIRYLESDPQAEQITSGGPGGRVAAGEAMLKQRENEKKETLNVSTSSLSAWNVCVCFEGALWRFSLQGIKHI